jgi:hypothetical protein
VKPANRRENRRDRRFRQHRTGKRRVVVVIRERNGRTLPGVFNSEVEALNFIRRQVPRGTELYAAGLFRLGTTTYRRHQQPSDRDTPQELPPHAPSPAWPRGLSLKPCIGPKSRLRSR